MWRKRETRRRNWREVVPARHRIRSYCRGPWVRASTPAVLEDREGQADLFPARPAADPVDRVDRAEDSVVPVDEEGLEEAVGNSEVRVDPEAKEVPAAGEWRGRR